jgi:hypothetical protein
MGRINIVQMTVLLKAIYRFSAMPIKVSMSFFAVIEMSILKFICKQKRPRKAKVILSKKSNAEGIKIWTSNYTTKSE